MNNFNRDFKNVDTSEQISVEKQILQSITFILVTLMSVFIFALLAVK